MVHNTSALGVGGFYVDFYEGDPDTGGTLLESVPVAALAASQITTVSASWDSDLKVGPHFFYVVVDSRSNIGERNEQNNRANAPLTVLHATQPDLQVVSAGITLEPEDAATGDLVQITAIVTNGLRFDASNVRVRFVRTDPVLGESSPLGQTTSFDRGQGPGKRFRFLRHVSGRGTGSSDGDRGSAQRHRGGLGNEQPSERLPAAAAAGRGSSDGVAGNGQEASVLLRWDTSLYPGSGRLLRAARRQADQPGVEEVGAGGTALASSSASGFAAALALDTNLFTGWLAVSASNQWWSVRLTKPHYVHSLALVWGKRAHRPDIRSPGLERP